MEDFENAGEPFELGGEHRDLSEGQGDMAGEKIQNENSVFLVLSRSTSPLLQVCFQIE